MPERIIFNSSMPRSGSTLLQNILAQNPRFYCTPTSGLLDMLMASRTIYSKSPEFKAQDSDVVHKAFLAYCRQAMIGFFDGQTDKPICCDKSRAWIQYYDWLKQFWPDPKIVVCIRDLRAVLASMEKLFRKNQHIEEWSEVPGKSVNLLTIDNRVRHWMNTIPVGVSTLRINGAIQTGSYKKFHFVRFEDLTANPKAEMKKVYEYLEEPAFEHDFDHVEQKTTENDAIYLTYGDHTIREKVAPVKADFEEVLGRDICTAVKQENRLFFKTFYPGTK